MPAIMLMGKNYSGSGHAHFMETTEPDNNIGINGDLYTLYSGQEIITVYQKINGAWLPFPKGSGGGHSVRILTNANMNAVVRSNSTVTVTEN